jgi:hypothetical protein
MPEKPLSQSETQTSYDLSKPDFSFIPDGDHQYIQRGYYLVCTSCQLEHGVWIGADHLMVGIDQEGKPLLKTRKELNMA